MFVLESQLLVHPEAWGWLFVCEQGSRLHVAVVFMWQFSPFLLCVCTALHGLHARISVHRGSHA